MKKWIGRILSVVFLMIFLTCSFLLIMIVASDGGNPSLYRLEGEKEKQQNPIDFKKLKEVNPDIYAWIFVPGTQIDYPILSEPDGKKDYYLTHNFKNQFDFAGAIYSQSANKKGLTDPVTVLYGHNMLNGSMFGNLKKFENKKYFQQRDKIFIYTPEEIKTYQILSFYESDARNILQRYGYFQLEKQIEDFHSEIQYQKNGNVRADVGIAPGDRILTLSTCSILSSNRRILNAVLTDEKKWEQ